MNSNVHMTYTSGKTQFRKKFSILLKHFSYINNQVELEYSGIPTDSEIWMTYTR